MLRCWSIAYSSAMRTGSLVVISVVAVLTTSLLVVAAMNASSVVGEEEKNGGLWCSPIANTSIPTSSVFCAICTIASIRSASLGVSPETGSRVMSLTEKIPNCMSCLSCAAGSRVAGRWRDICVCMYLSNAESRDIPLTALCELFYKYWNNWGSWGRTGRARPGAEQGGQDLGPNRAGKTTTVRILGTLIAPTAGSAVIDGIELSPACAAEIRQRISIMPEASGPCCSRITGPGG